MSKVPLHVLPGFVAAARLLNLSRAAASLHVTVSALSHQMRGLEELLGQRLFDRGPRGLRLTPPGSGSSGRWRRTSTPSPRRSRPSRRGARDALTVSVMPSVASSWLIPRLPAFTARHPEVELSLQSTIDLVDFDREEVDAAIRFGPGGWPGLRAHLLFEEWVVPVCSPELLRRFPQARAGGLRRGAAAPGPRRAVARLVRAASAGARPRGRWRRSTTPTRSSARRWRAWGWRWAG